MGWIVHIWNTLHSYFPWGLDIIRAVFGFVFVCLLPGYAWSLVFFSGRELNLLERLVLSFGLSVAIVVLSIFFLNLVFEVKITLFHSLLTIFVLIVVPLSFHVLRKWSRGQDLRRWQDYFS